MSHLEKQEEGMDWGEFRALEYFAILFDIAIDAEQYNPDWCSISLKGKDGDYYREDDGIDMERNKPWSLKRILVLPTPDLRPSDLDPNQLDSVIIDLPLSTKKATGSILPARWPTPLELGPNHRKDLCPHQADLVSLSWKNLLIAKRIRAMLQSNGSTAAFEALDQLGLTLTQALPRPKAAFSKDEDAELQLFLLKTLFLNEVSQCYKDARSIAFSDDCLELIKSEIKRLDLDTVGRNGKGVTPYELIAMYNKAHGYLHLKEHETAFREFERVADEFDSNRSNNDYFSNGTISHLAWDPEDHLLWETFLSSPAILQKADVLVNLQRSKEAVEHLAGLDEDCLNNYQIRRKTVLQGRAELDSADPQDFPHINEHLPPFESAAWEERNLQIQRLSVETQYWQVCSRRKLHLMTRFNGDRKPDEDETSILANDLIDNVKKTGESIVSRFRMASGERSETDQAIFDWVDGLDICADALSQLKKAQCDCSGLFDAVAQYTRLETPEEWGQTLRLSRVAQELALDDKYRDLQFATRRTLVHSGWKLFSAAKATANQAEDHERFLEELRRTNLCLLEELESKNREERQPAPEYEIFWRTQLKALYKGDLLPVVKDNSTINWDPHSEFRRVLSQWFVKCKTQDCESNPLGKYQCFEEESSNPEWKSSKVEPKCAHAKKALRNKVEFLLGTGESWHHYVDQIQKRNEEVFDARLYSNSDHSTPSGWGFAVLQRWNSYTPALNASEGGGYFLFRQSKLPDPEPKIEEGLAVDPGYGFLKNFFSERFGICDISAIAVTHNHPDHLADFQAAVNLLLEARKDRLGKGLRKRESRKIQAILSKGAFEQLLPIIEGARQVFRDTREIAARTDVPLSPQLKVSGCTAIHKDASDRPDRPGCDSLGLILEVSESTRHARIGLPSDTKWDPEVVEQYLESPPCNLLCAHVGSILRSATEMTLPEYFSNKLTASKVLQDGWHLYFPGTVWFLKQVSEGLKKTNELKPVLVVLSEFGEEMRGGLRIVLASTLQKYATELLGDKLVVIPGDIGLVIDPINNLIQCSCCNQFYPCLTWRNSGDEDSKGAYEVFGDVEQIFYVCPSCKEALSLHQRAAIFTERQVPIYRRLALNDR